jgi:competence protein ComEC
VSAYLIAHHGNYDSSVPAVYTALRPRVAIMNNGPRKGGHPAAFEAARSYTGLEGLWQLHAARSPADNAPHEFIANVDDDGSDGYPIRLTAQDDGSFVVSNARNGVTRHYAAR